MTADELRTILGMALRLARADKNVAELEQEILDGFSSALGLSDDERAAIADENIQPADAVARLSSGEAREFLMKSLCAVAFADGLRHDSEIELIAQTHELVGGSVSLKPWEEWESYVEEVIDTLLQFSPGG